MLDRVRQKVLEDPPEMPAAHPRARWPTTRGTATPVHCAPCTVSHCSTKGVAQEVTPVDSEQRSHPSQALHNGYDNAQ